MPRSVHIPVNIKCVNFVYILPLGIVVNGGLVPDETESKIIHLCNSV